MTVKYRAIFDDKGKAAEYENGVLVWCRDDFRQGPASCSATAVLGDIPDFVSPIDGSVVRGRAGLRDHCARHDVVPTAELKGLPPKTLNQEYQLSAAERSATKRTIAEIMNSRGY